ncbi:BON domain-containing protein [Paraglaciecola sp. MB-3u-78]|jgi:osmotically-inducible protein OsmY|uniref:BON domain-containing protein n=1 Tax=Paraglaciecola sp. MB-3u-78 TaxID=2058332 RepID=UPI000C324BB8|nr:BON domain-containing protein [Paraglaciecola sp. MB-3u-78]PKH00282.1 BON domain-containing protein [Paraglaciecola sp. MB-3u-78]
MLKLKNIYIPLLLSTTLLLQGCAGLIIGAGVGAASVAHDRRTLGTQVDDTTAAGRISTAISNDVAINEQASISVQVFNGTALLIGQAPTQALIQQAEKLALSVKNIKKLHNQVRLGLPIPPSVVANDAWLASKVKTKLIADKRIDGLHIEIEVENGEVFLMGLVSEQESNIAVEITRNIQGVKQVIKAFEYT